MADWFGNFCTVFKRGGSAGSADDGSHEAAEEAAAQGAAGKGAGRGRRGRPRKQHIANQVRLEARDGLRLLSECPQLSMPGVAVGA